MSQDRMQDEWQVVSIEALSGIAEWRLQHPRATWNQIEQAVEERLSRLRTRILQDAAQHSAAAKWSQGEGERPRCGTDGVHE